VVVVGGEVMISRYAQDVEVFTTVAETVKSHTDRLTKRDATSVRKSSPPQENGIIWIPILNMPAQDATARQRCDTSHARTQG
jgi:hypothetical protein